MEKEANISKLSKVISDCSDNMIEIKHRITQMDYDLYHLREKYKHLKLDKEKAKDELLELLMEDKKEVTKSE